MDKKEVLFEVQHIYKSFSGVPVLKDLGFSIKKGEIHALMGENGAGKSTIIKIITGIYTKDAGSFLHNGKEVKINGKKDAEKIGISTIFQELSLIPVLSVAENIYLGKEIVNIFGKVNKKERLKKAQELIDQYEFPLRADEKVENLSIAQKQLVEILKALSTKASILIMDVKYSIVLIVYGVYRVKEKRKIGTTYTNRKKNVYDVIWKRIRKILKAGRDSGSFFML